MLRSVALASVCLGADALPIHRTHDHLTHLQNLAAKSAAAAPVVPWSVKLDADDDELKKTDAMIKKTEGEVAKLPIAHTPTEQEIRDAEYAQAKKLAEEQKAAVKAADSPDPLTAPGLKLDADDDALKAVDAEIKKTEAEAAKLPIPGIPHTATEEERREAEYAQAKKLAEEQKAADKAADSPGRRY